MTKPSELKLARITKGLSQWELSIRTGLTPWKISLGERGYRSLTTEEAKKVSKVLDIDLENKEQGDQ